MPLADLTDPTAVLAAIAEYDRIGSEAFRDDGPWGRTGQRR